MQKRNAVEAVVSMGKGSHHRACRVLGLARSSACYRTKVDANQLRQEGLIEEISRENPVYGYRKVTALLRQGGEAMNSKRVARIAVGAAIHQDLRAHSESTGVKTMYGSLISFIFRAQKRSGSGFYVRALSAS